MAQENTPPITGYRQLDAQEIELINLIKAKAAEVDVLMSGLRSRGAAVDQRWVAIATTDLQKGFMCAVCAVAQPTTF